MESGSLLFSVVGEDVLLDPTSRSGWRYHHDTVWVVRKDGKSIRPLPSHEDRQ